MLCGRDMGGNLAVQRGCSLAVVASSLITGSACGGPSAQGGTPDDRVSVSVEDSDASAVDGSPNGAAAASTPTAACGWPATLAGLGEVAGNRCVAGRVYLSCSGSTGGGELCLSDDSTRCPGPNPVVGETFSNCQDQCHSEEYGVACGGPGPGLYPDPPAGCRQLPSGPGGGTVWCCPCFDAGSPDSGGGTSRDGEPD
jgi:hypothetical protein